MKYRYLFLTLAALTIVTQSGCGTISRHKTAEKISATADMLPRNIQATPFTLKVYEKIKKHGHDATIYIEGDGLAWAGRNTPSLDPTPTDPIALRLAVQDNSPNVIYIARPCQYRKMSAPNEPCPLKYWTSHRFAPEVIGSANLALENIKSRYNISGFNLVGFSGGATVAVLLAANRNDILSLRTVAGNLDHKLLHNIHDVTQLTGSLNPIDVANKISNLPQHHFIGSEDKIITPVIYQSFERAAKDTSCMRHSIIKRASHESGWAEQWAELLTKKLGC